MSRGHIFRLVISYGICFWSEKGGIYIGNRSRDINGARVKGIRDIGVVGYIASNIFTNDGVLQNVAWHHLPTV